MAWRAQYFTRHHGFEDNRSRNPTNIYVALLFEEDNTRQLITLTNGSIPEELNWSETFGAKSAPPRVLSSRKGCVVNGQMPKASKK